MKYDEVTRSELIPAVAIPGVVKFIRIVLVSLVKPFPSTRWAREWKKLSRQGKLDRTIRVYAPFVESFFMGVAYWGITLLAQAALPMVGLDPGILSNVSILSVLNVIFGLLHTEVYRKNPATGDWERQPANLGTRMGIAVIGLAFHSPLLLSTLNPILAPLSFIGGNIAASLLSGFLHRMYNNLVVPRLGKDQVSKIAKAAAVSTLAELLRTNLLGNSVLNLELNELTKSRLSPLIRQVEREDISERDLIVNLKAIGNEQSTKPLLRHIRSQLRDKPTPLIARMFEFAGARWAEQSSGPLAIAMHDWSDWQNNKNFIAFIKGAVGSAAKSNRKIIIAASPEHQKAIRSIFQLPSNTTFRENEIHGQILDAGEFSKAAETKTLLAANAKRMENTAGLDLFYLERISRAITTEIRWLGKILEQA